MIFRPAKDRRVSTRVYHPASCVLARLSMFGPAIISVLWGKIRAMHLKNCACLLALAIAAHFNLQVAKASEPPTEFAYHISVVNGSTIGSAFMMDAGVVVTNAHVLAGLREGEQVSLLASTGVSVVARIEAISRRMDLAVLSVSEGHAPIVPRAHTQARRGEKIVAVGIVASSRNPRWRHIVRGLVVSEPRSVAPFGRGVIARMALLEKGFSGGPVFDSNGGLVGMVAAVRPAHKSPSGHREAFIISADEIRSEVSRLVSSKTNGHYLNEFTRTESGYYVAFDHDQTHLFRRKQKTSRRHPMGDAGAHLFSYIS